MCFPSKKAWDIRGSLDVIVQFVFRNELAVTFVSIDRFALFL